MTKVLLNILSVFFHFHKFFYEGHYKINAVREIFPFGEQSSVPPMDIFKKDLRKSHFFLKKEQKFAMCCFLDADFHDLHIICMLCWLCLFGDLS